MVKASVKKSWLTIEREQTLCAAAQQGDVAALDKVLSVFQRLIFKLAWRYACPPVFCYEDCVSEGWLGAIAAVRTFDPSRERRLSTLIYRCVTNRLGRALLDQAPTVKLPAGIVRQLRDLDRLDLVFEERRGRLPTDAEAATALAVEEEGVRFLRSLPRVGCSLDAPVTSDAAGDEPDTLLDFLRCSELTPLETVMARSECVTIVAALAQLEALGAEVVRRRFGLAPHWGTQTLGEIALALGLTSQKVHRILGASLNQLRVALEAPGAVVSAAGRRPETSSRRVEVVHLASLGWSGVLIANTLGVTRGYVSQVLTQARRSRP